MIKNYVLICVVQPFSNNIIFVMKKRPEWQKGKFNLVGGKIEEGENEEQAALRELKEETGYKPHKNYPNLIKSGVLENKDGSKVYCFKAIVDVFEKLHPTPGEGETELIKWCNWGLMKTDNRLINNLRIIVPLMINDICDWKLIEVSPDIDDEFIIKLPNKENFKINLHVSNLFN